MKSTVPLVRIHRGARLESSHHGVFILLRRDEVLAQGGDPDEIVFYRSASKALQALVAVTSGAADRFGLTPAALALAAGSHSGTALHIRTARAMLEAAGIDEARLGCGAHWPFDRASAQAARADHERPIAVFSNCSGKHAAMLAAAKAMGAPLDTYLDPAHPVQQTIRTHVATLAGVPLEQVEVMVDGCGAPTFALPLQAAARSMQRLGVTRDLPGPLADAAGRVMAAALAHPEMIGGPGRFDTELMRHAAVPLMAKAGAEGVHATVIPQDDTVLFVKVQDGADRGYRRFVVDTLTRLGYLTTVGAEEVSRTQCAAELTNHAGDVVGRVESVDTQG